jgi:NTE family protein
MRAPWSASPGSVAAAALPAGRVPAHHIAAPLRALFGSRWPDRPTWIVAVQLDTGRRVVFGRDASATLPDAVRASCAIPAFFEPVQIDGHRYVDGGVHSTTNADVVADARPDLVLVSAPMSAARGAVRGLELPMRQFARLSLAREVAGLRSRGIPVVVFHPTAADLEVMSGDALDQRKVAPVCARVLETVGQRLRSGDLTARLGALSS